MRLEIPPRINASSGLARIELVTILSAPCVVVRRLVHPRPVLAAKPRLLIATSRASLLDVSVTCSKSFCSRHSG